MKRSVSPLFAVIVIVVALVLGALWFLVRYRTNEAREAELARMLQQQADQARASGRMGRGRQRMLSRGTRAPASDAPVDRGEEGTSTGGESTGE
jgi:cytoskeletal protein RodZ